MYKLLIVSSGIISYENVILTLHIKQNYMGFCVTLKNLKGLNTTQFIGKISMKIIFWLQ